jgi:hypothetical protein
MTIFLDPAPVDLRSPPARCRVCHRPLPRAFALCFCCDTLVAQLRMPLVPVVDMGEYRVGDRIHGRLRGYKDAPTAEVRHRCRDDLVAMAIRWLGEYGPPHGGRLGWPWDAVATVPSSRRPGAPVDAIVDRVPALARPLRLGLTRGSRPTGHLRADRFGFDLAPDVDRPALRSLRVLVLDDSVVTGARAQSAAATLRLAGAGVVGVLALGRAVGIERPGGGP